MATLLQKQLHSNNVSAIEKVWWTVALAAWEARDFSLSANVVQAGGQAEHFLAEIDPDPAGVTVEESDELQRRLLVLQDLVTQAGSRGYGGPPMPTLPPIQVR